MNRVQQRDTECKRCEREKDINIKLKVETVRQERERVTERQIEGLILN